MAERRMRGLKDRKIAALETELQIKTSALAQRTTDLTHSQDRERQLHRDLLGMQHQIDNYRTQTFEMGSRIGVLESDRDRLTTVVEVLARRIVSPQAEKDRSRAGWRSFTTAMTPRDDREAGDRDAGDRAGDRANRDEAPRKS